jgi:hypothetical protein
MRRRCRRRQRFEPLDGALGRDQHQIDGIAGHRDRTLGQ